MVNCLHLLYHIENRMVFYRRRENNTKSAYQSTLTYKTLITKYF